MGTYTTRIIAVTLLVIASSQAQAKNTESNQENPRQRPCFSSIDTNGDGDIDLNEFSSHKLPHGDHQTVFNTIDSDKNGIISHEEFVNHKPPHRKNRREE